MRTETRAAMHVDIMPLSVAGLPVAELLLLFIVLWTTAQSATTVDQELIKEMKKHQHVEIEKQTAEVSYQKVQFHCMLL